MTTTSPPPAWTRAAVGLLLGALATSASGCSDDWEDCEDAECRLRTAEAGFRENPTRVLADLRLVQDEIEQAALVEVLAHADPSRVAQICAVPRVGTLASERCNRLSLRPHLYNQANGASATPRARRRAGSGPATDYPTPADVPAPWRDTEADEANLERTCGKSASCRQEFAMAEANAGKVAAAGATCATAWPAESTALHECWFQVAEHAMLQSGGATLSESIAACAHAGTFAGNCTQHIVLMALPQAPPANRPDKASVAAAVATVDALRKAGGKRAGDELASLAWSKWTLDAFEAASAPAGHLLAALPADAAPHVRDGAAWAWLNRHNVRNADLERVANTLAQALAVTGPLSTSPSSVRARGTFTPPSTPWHADRNDDDAALDTVFCLNAGRRATVADANVDLRIAVLEAAGRVRPPVTASFFVDVLGSQQPYEVRWTAARMAVVVDPAAAAAALDRDPDERIRASLKADLASITGNASK